MIRVNVVKKLITAQGPINLRVNFSVEKGEFAAIYGATGTGKTTILRMIAGLLNPDQGVISVQGQVWFDSFKKINIPTRNRSIGFVFQEHSLFPNMTIRENLEYALVDKTKSNSIDEFLKIISLKELQDRRPDQLSGGQRQRVALIRALLREPLVYLLDEPLSALDVEMRRHLQDEIIRLYRNSKTTTIFVSHEISEVFKLAHKVFNLNAEGLITSGTAEEILMGNQMSGKFKFTGEIIGIRKDQGINIVSILVGNNSVKVVATDYEIKDISTGSKVTVASKAFNPIIKQVTRHAV